MTHSDGKPMSTTYDLIYPHTHLRVLARRELQQLTDVNSTTHELLRRCCYAVLNSDTETDDYIKIDASYQNFNLEVVPQSRGLALKLTNPPASAFVGDEIIQGIREQVFSVLRDIVYAQESIFKTYRFDLDRSGDITDSVFYMLRNANVLRPEDDANLVICWGGHSIPRHEYEYTKKVGYHMGLRGLNVGTGCGPGAMKGPMKGCTIGHAKQHIRHGRYIGITEPGIIATEAPNPIVNELVILPDIEKRLEAFVRTAHGIVIFPGGPGTCEEILYLLGILLHDNNKDAPFPVVITGPSEAGDYLRDIDAFIGQTLGQEAQDLYELIIDDPIRAAETIDAGMHTVRQHRMAHNESFFFNWALHIDADFQHPFDPTHDNMSTLELSHSLPKSELAANLRKAFSGIVAGNVKREGIERVQAHGRYQLHGDKDILDGMDTLLSAMVSFGRMKISGQYTPCYDLVR